MTVEEGEVIDTPVPPPSKKGRQNLGSDRQSTQDGFWSKGV
jgi:hypothetical protein